MFTIGRVVIKIAGRDAGLYGVIVEEHDNRLVTIDGQVRRRKCNVAHLEPTKQTVEVKKGASSEDVAKALGKIGITVAEKGKSREKGQRQTRQKIVKAPEAKKEAKKVAKKEEAPKKVAKKAAKKAKKAE